MRKSILVVLGALGITAAASRLVSKGRQRAHERQSHQWGDNLAFARHPGNR